LPQTFGEFAKLVKGGIKLQEGQCLDASREGASFGWKKKVAHAELKKPGAKNTSISHAPS
jgi:hypothetical protein